MCGASSHAAEQGRGAVRIRIDDATVLAKIADDFMGFGYETSAVAQPGYFSGKNARLINLYKNLGPHGLIRIGGNVSDHTRFVADGSPAAKTEREVTIINQSKLNDLGDFARETGWRVMWGLNLGTGTKDEAAEEAVAVDRALGASLQSFEIGNEVDLLKKYAKDYDAYHAAYAEYKAAIRKRLPGAAFSGPDSAASVAFVERFVTAESGDMKLATHHYYRTGAHDPKATIETLLARDGGFDHRLDQLRTLCAGHHVEYRINETNSFFGGGKEGVSDTFASALWCLDYMLDLAAHGCAGVNMETDINQHGFISHYSPIVHDAAGVCSARPEYYGMLAFAMAGHGQMLKTTIDAGGINVVAYAIRDAHGAISLVAINKDLARDATIEFSAPAGFNKAEVYRLRAASANATTDVTFGGSSVAEDGTWHPAAPELSQLAPGGARFLIPRGSASVVRFIHD